MTDDATIHLRVPAATKGRWVLASRSAGLRLTDWITEAVEARMSARAENNGPTEFFNISGTVLAVMREIAAGTLHRRDIEDRLKISEKHAVRAIEKLASAGLVQLEPARDIGRGGKSLRIYRCHPTETGFLMLAMCDQIERHRRQS